MDYRMTEKLETCPYNSSHQIIPHRMAKHIIKCKKNYPDEDRKTCIFNAVHVVPAHQYQAHLLECEDRCLVERELFKRPSMGYEMPNIAEGASSVLKTICQSDDWESDSVQSSYSPEKHVIFKEFTRPPPPGMSKSARKEWRLKEIERVKALKAGVAGEGMNSELSAAGGALPKHAGNYGCDTSCASSISPKRNQDVLQKPRQSLEAVCTPSTDDSSSASATSSAKQVSQDRKGLVDMSGFIKEKRKLEKKLFEIKKLENMKFNLNEKLTVQEEAKIQLKDHVVEQLSSLMKLMSV